jgi:hypothetical protein
MNPLPKESWHIQPIRFAAGCALCRLEQKYHCEREDNLKTFRQPSTLAKPWAGYTASLGMNPSDDPELHEGQERSSFSKV